MTASRKALLALIAASLTLLVAAPASAQRSGALSSSWRQQNRSDAVAANIGSPQYFAFELRFGPYWPQVDNQFSEEKGPYEKVFGTGPQFYFGLEADFLPLRIPYVGLLGPGLGWGYTSTSAEAKIVSTGKPSGQDTSLSIMPMYAVAVLRVDEIMRRTWVPLVPYVKIGLGFALWKTTEGSSTSTYLSEDGNTRYTGASNSAGLQLALGGMLSLNFLDPRSAARLDASTGVNHIYLFGEWMNSRLNGLGSRAALRVGTSTFVGGLALDI
jgi:hypothetical protein